MTLRKEFEVSRDDALKEVALEAMRRARVAERKAEAALDRIDELSAEIELLRLSIPPKPDTT